MSTPGWSEPAFALLVALLDNAPVCQADVRHVGEPAIPAGRVWNT